jgi:hypothetical protein
MGRFLKGDAGEIVPLMLLTGAAVLAGGALLIYKDRYGNSTIMHKKKYPKQEASSMTVKRNQSNQIEEREG